MMLFCSECAAAVELEASASLHAIHLSLPFACFDLSLSVSVPTIRCSCKPLDECRSFRKFQETTSRFTKLPLGSYSVCDAPSTSHTRVEVSADYFLGFQHRGGHESMVAFRLVA